MSRNLKVGTKGFVLLEHLDMPGENCDPRNILDSIVEVEIVARGDDTDMIVVIPGADVEFPVMPEDFSETRREALLALATSLLRDVYEVVSELWASESTSILTKPQRLLALVGLALKKDSPEVGE